VDRRALAVGKSAATGEQSGTEALEPKPPESQPRKASQGQTGVTVPQTDTGRREENSKALGRTLVKELCKFPP
jgi:hypothetical protein